MCRFRKGEASLDLTHRQLLQLYRVRFCARKEGKGDDRRQHIIGKKTVFGDSKVAGKYRRGSESISEKHGLKYRQHYKPLQPSETPVSCSATSEGRGESSRVPGGSIDGIDNIGGSLRASSSSGSEDATEERPQFKPLTESFIADARKPSRSPISVDSEHKNSESVAFVPSSNSYRTKKEDSRCKHPKPPKSGSPLRPILAGPAATEVMATLGGEPGVGRCANSTVVMPRAAKTTGDGERSFDGDEKSMSQQECGGGSSVNEPDGRVDGAAGHLSPTSLIYTASVSTALKVKGKEKTAKPAITKLLSPCSLGRRIETATNGQKDDGTIKGSLHVPPPFLAEMLRTLESIELSGGSTDKGPTGNGGRANDLAAAEGGNARGSQQLPGETSLSDFETAGSRRQARVRAMEHAKRLVLNLDGEAVIFVTFHLEELLTLVLRLADDPDFKIVRRSFHFYQISFKIEHISKTLSSYIFR